MPLSGFVGFLRDPAGYLDDVATYGPVASFRRGGQDVFLVSDLDLVRRVLAADLRDFTKSSAMNETRRVVGNGLLTSEGDYHVAQRRLVRPPLQARRIAALAPAMVEIAEEETAGWSDGLELDLHRALARLTLRVVGVTLFAVDLADRATEIADDLQYTLRMFGRLRLPLARSWERSPLPSARRLGTAVTRLRDASEEILVRRRALADAPADDVLGLLLAGRDGAPLSERELQDEIATLLSAGHETTGTTVAWALTLLARHPRVREQVEAEVDAVLDGRAPSVEDVPRLELMLRVLRETLRLYPPVWMMGRTPKEDFDLGGYRVPAGSTLLLCHYLIHRDPRRFPDPSRFDPSRWEDGAEPAPVGALPFGAGPRRCPGADFALLEARLVMAVIMRRWRIETVPGREAKPGFFLVLRPRHGAPVRVRARLSRGDEQSEALDTPHLRVWNASQGQRLWRDYSDAVNSALVERWLPPGLERVLKTDLWDEAVGRGLVPTLGRLAERVDGIDISEDVADAARSHYPELGVTVTDVRRMPFADGSFDAVVSNSTLDHFDRAEEIKAALWEIRRVLRPGGTLVLTLDNPRNPLVAATKALPRSRVNQTWLRHGKGFSRLGLLPYSVGVTVGPSRLRRMLDWAGLELELQEEVVHAPRLPAVVFGHLVEAYGSARAERGFARLLRACERLRALPASGTTGNFVAVRARRL